MSFKTPDLCDAFEAELGKSVRVVAPMFQRYGGRTSFSGQIVTLKLFEDNASTLTPDPVYAGFYYSHPPATERLARMAT